jgi:hypothetical protein
MEWNFKILKYLGKEKEFLQLHGIYKNIQNKNPAQAANKEDFPSTSNPHQWLTT